jgi:membrane-associated protein
MHLATIASIATIASFAAGIHRQPWFLETLRAYGYVALAGFIGAQDLGIPTIVPGSVLLLCAGYLASVGIFDPVDAGGAAVLAALAGSSIVFLVFRRLGAPLFRIFPRLKHLHDSRKEQMERFIRRWGLAAWLVLRFMPGFRAALAIVSGLSGISYARFGVLTVVASAIWAYVFILIGYVLGTHWQRAIRLAIASGPITLLLVILIGGILIARRIAHARWKHQVT